jgi:hypothetical protein
MSYTAALTPGEGGWICAETAEAPEAISQGRMLEEAKANVAEALGERAQVTVTPRPMRPPHRPVDVSAPMDGGRRARESRICRETRAEESDPRSLSPRQMGRKSGPARNVVDADYPTRDAGLTQKGGYLQAKTMARARIELATPRFSVVCSTN